MKESDCIHAYECGLTERCKGCGDYKCGNPNPPIKLDDLITGEYGQVLKCVNIMSEPGGVMVYTFRPETKETE